MTSFFGPETPVPFCVATEMHLSKKIDRLFEEKEIQRQILANEWNQQDHIDSDRYEKEFCHKINKYLEIDCIDDVLYIRAEGDENTSAIDYASNSVKNWPKIMEKRFCLLKPVDVAQIKYSKKKKESMEDEHEISFECEFTNCENKNKKYDKIIIKNCLKYFENNHKYFCDFIMKLFKQQNQKKTSLLFIQRVFDLNTLPYTNRVYKQWSDHDTKYAQFMQLMQNEYFSLKFDIEVIKYIIDCKSTWYKNLKEKYTYPLNTESGIVQEEKEKRKEFIHGIRELNEGVFKYQQLDTYIELTDRMLFIGAHHLFSRQAALAERIKKEKKDKVTFNPKADLEINDEITKLSMEITPDIRPILNSLNPGKRRTN